MRASGRWLVCPDAAALTMAACAQVVGFVAGYVLESFRVTVYAVFGGVIIASAICVPDWGIFKSECALLLCVLSMVACCALCPHM